MVNLIWFVKLFNLLSFIKFLLIILLNAMTDTRRLLTTIKNAINMNSSGKVISNVVNTLPKNTNITTLKYDNQPITELDLKNWIVMIKRNTEPVQEIIVRVISKNSTNSGTIYYIGTTIDNPESISFDPEQIVKILQTSASNKPDVDEVIVEEPSPEPYPEINLEVTNEIEDYSFEIPEEMIPKEITISNELDIQGIQEDFESSYKELKQNFIDQFSTHKPIVEAKSSEFFSGFLSDDSSEHDSDEIDNVIMYLDKLTSDIRNRISNKINKNGIDPFKRTGYLTGDSPSDISINSIDSVMSFAKMEVQKSGKIEHKTAMSLITFLLEYLITININDETC